MKLLFATRNSDKAKEIRQMLTEKNDLSIQVLTLSDLGLNIELVEDGSTFLENAQKKARQVYAVIRQEGKDDIAVLSEDSGLEIDALGGKPGVTSKRFAGETSTANERNRHVLELMADLPEECRRARFRCVMCLIDSTGREKIFEGICEGKIAHAIRGNSGFGYDPIFIPEGYTQTFGELGDEVKNKISHRAKAFHQVISFLKV